MATEADAIMHAAQKMTRTTTVKYTCDQCSAFLGYSGYDNFLIGVDISLRGPESERLKPQRRDMSRHFCNWKCFSIWVQIKRQEDFKAEGK